MRERKYVKLRVDMYEDTKFKIIDMKPERDVIFYIWNRLVLLAGKVNLEGELFLSKNMPYTIETLAIEFNRDPSQIKLALEIFIELQMLELTEAKVYAVKNFAKHQNIKKKEIAKPNEAEINNINGSLNINLEVQKNADIDKKAEDGAIEDISEKLEATNGLNLETVNKDTAISDNSKEDRINGATSEKNNTILFHAPKNKKRTKKKKDDRIDIAITEEETIDAESIDEEINGFIDGDIPLSKDETILLEWSFG
jgi:predicted phage replisome organizer